MAEHLLYLIGSIACFSLVAQMVWDLERSGINTDSRVSTSLTLVACFIWVAYSAVLVISDLINSL